MADTYVSQTATNGYAIGDDANDGLTKATAKLTIESALAAAGTGGDTVTINDGTYDDATNYLNVTKANITFEPETDYLAIIRPVVGGGGQARAVNISASGVTFGRVVIDAAGVVAACVTMNAGTSGTTFRGTKFIGATGNIIGNPSNTTDVTLDNGWIIDCSDFSGGTGIGFNTGAAGDIVIKDGTFITANQTTGSSNKHLISVTPSVSGVNLTVSNVTFSVSDGAGKGTTLINGTGCATYDIHDNVWTGTGDRRVTGIVLNNHATLTTSKCHVYNNTGSATLSLAGGAVQGYGTLVGSETTGGGDDSISDCRVYGNDFSNCNHGVLIGFASGARVYGNKIADVILGLVVKGDLGGTAVGGNLVQRCSGAVLYTKGSVDCSFGNNTVILSTGNAAEALYTGDNAAVNSTGTLYHNNIIYTDVEPARVTYTDVANTATYTNNNFYYTGGALTSNDFQYQGTSYASLALWEAGVATASDNTEVDPEWDANYTPNIGSAMLATGVKWWVNAPPEGVDGEPFPSFDIDKGCYQGSDATNHPFHPLNL